MEQSVFMAALPSETDVLVVGAGPAGAAAAAWAARSGLDVVLADAAAFPRDKTCGDGLTPRAMAELDRLGLGPWTRSHATNQGLRAHGFGQTLELPWPGGSLPDHGSAVPRTELDDKIRKVALDAGAVGLSEARAVDVLRTERGVERVGFLVPEDADATTGSAAGGLRAGPRRRHEVKCRRLIVADGVRSPVGKMLGRQWHRDSVYGVAARSYLDSGREDSWISSHLELRGEQGELLSGYGWIFPLGGGRVNLGVGTLATARRPAKIALRPLMEFYARQRREEWQLSERLEQPTSALLPMGGAVSGVAGPNWALIGDAAACVNPLNGEGIDYGLETGRVVVSLLEGSGSLEESWPALLRDHYGASFSIARRLGALITVPGLLGRLGPIGMRSRPMMTLALRVMGNLITDEDHDAVARLWRTAGRLSVRVDHRAPFC